MCSSNITSTESCMNCEYLLVNWSMLMTRGFFFFPFIVELSISYNGCCLTSPAGLIGLGMCSCSYYQ